MDSNKSSTLTALTPRRRPGRQRVAELLEAGATVIAERGYQAATMAEIAERAGAQIGSLYRFFPNKEVLADALVQRFRDRMHVRFEELTAIARTGTLGDFTDALLSAMDGHEGDRAVIRALLEAHVNWSAKRQEFRADFVAGLARLLRARQPGLAARTAHAMGLVLLHTIKTHALLKERHKGQELAAALEELREMTRGYLEARLGR